MAWTTRARELANHGLRRMNLRLDTLTREREEARRLGRLERDGWFDRPAYELSGWEGTEIDGIWRALERHRDRLADLADPGRNAVGYRFDNPYFSSPDAEVMYVLLRRLRPARFVEIGCGHSTRVVRQAILDEGLATRIMGVDPEPREAIAHLVDELYARPVESLPLEIFDGLGVGDVLSIDSGHRLATGGDVPFLYLRVLPRLQPGVVVHVHDVFLPYDYPRAWVVDERREFTEQYLLHAILAYGHAFDVLWAGHYLQRTRPDFAGRFPHMGGRTAQSLWLRRSGGNGDATRSGDGNGGRP